MHSNSGLFNQRRPSCKGQRLKMKGRWFSFKDLSRASSPRNFLVFISMEEKERASNPWDVSVQEESSHKIPKSKGARQVYQSSVCSWSGGRKAYTELTGVEKSTLGLCYGNRDSLGLVTAHAKKKFLVESRESCKDKQEHGSSQNDKAKEPWASSHRLRKQQNWILFTRYSLTYFLSTFLEKRSKERKHIPEVQTSWKIS